MDQGCDRGHDEPYIALVDYHLPTYLELLCEFKDLNPLFQTAEFRPIPACSDVPLCTRRVMFRMIRLPVELDTPNVFALHARVGCRPARFEELLGFAHDHPLEQLSSVIVAIGSIWRDPYDEILVPCISYAADALFRRLTPDFPRVRTLDLLPHFCLWPSFVLFLSVPL